LGFYYGYRRRSDLGAIIMLGIFIAVIAITIFVEYLLYGVLTINERQASSFRAG
jgi:hypothetical protein